MKYYFNKYLDTLTSYPLGVGYDDSIKLPLRVKFILWLLGFKKHKSSEDGK